MLKRIVIASCGLLLPLSALAGTYSWTFTWDHVASYNLSDPAVHYADDGLPSTSTSTRWYSLGTGELAGYETGLNSYSKDAYTTMDMDVAVTWTPDYPGETAPGSAQFTCDRGYEATLEVSTSSNATFLSAYASVYSELIGTFEDSMPTGVHQTRDSNISQTWEGNETFTIGLTTDVNGVAHGAFTVEFGKMEVMASGTSNTMTAMEASSGASGKHYFKIVSYDH